MILNKKNFLNCIFTVFIKFSSFCPSFAIDEIPDAEQKSRENDVIYLPVCNNGKPDYDYMEQYISELASSVINSLNALEYAEEEH